MEKINTFLKGKRTYIALALAGIAQFLPLLGLDKQIAEAITVLLLAAAAWFRKQA